ncbi:hypothetical protein NADFUDRAFT_52211 [Nadsonia fulvescens var. elongata DSM 6958]|uniref:Plasma membrane fusion protein PRM1 n=1 Tax=Nadsonia fulvescens var. elongata DSM 6958 TaxID=857566 RepID=A0A1E3PI88_9ASCO|nr:hypothetical protein NADFUDRAFT_52211 [Nadsonia fulvescens var. elongata DSM 6958]
MSSRSVISSFYDISLRSPLSPRPKIPEIPHPYREPVLHNFGHEYAASSIYTDLDQSKIKTKTFSDSFCDSSSNKSATLTSFSFPNTFNKDLNCYVSKTEPEYPTESKIYINRATDLLPYLGLLARISQTLFNKITLITVVIIIQTVIFSKFLQYGIREAQSTTENSCSFINSLGSSISYGPQLIYSVVGTLVSAQFDLIKSTVVRDIQSGISQFSNESQKTIVSLSESYEGILQLSALVANSSSLNTTQYLTEWVKHAINSTTTVIEGELNEVKSSLKGLQSTLSESSVLFQNISMGSVQNISLQNVRDIKIPTDTNGELAKLASSETNIILTISNNTTHTINSELLALNEKIKGLSMDSIYNSSKIEKYFSDSQSSLNVGQLCMRDSQIVEYFSHISNSLRSSLRACIISLAVIGMTIILLVMLYEYFVTWKGLESFARNLHEGELGDVIDKLNYLTSPVVSRLGNYVCKYFINDEVRTSLRWLFRYIFSDRFLFLLLIVSSGYISTICQQSLLSSLVNNHNTDTFGTGSSGALVWSNNSRSYDESIEVWANKTNVFMNEALTNMSETISIEMITPIQSINDTIDAYSSKLVNQFNKYFNGSVLDSFPQNSTLMNDILSSLGALANNTAFDLKNKQTVLMMSKPLSILEMPSIGNQYFLSLPGAQLAKSLSTTPTGSSISKIMSNGNTSTLDDIITVSNRVISVQIRMYGVLLSIWALYILLSGLRVGIIILQTRRNFLIERRT